MKARVRDSLDLKTITALTALLGVAGGLLRGHQQEQKHEARSSEAYVEQRWLEARIDSLAEAIIRERTDRLRVEGILLRDARRRISGEGQYPSTAEPDGPPAPKSPGVIHRAFGWLTKPFRGNP